MQLGFAEELRAIRRRVKQQLGQQDVDHIVRVARLSRVLEASGRLLLHFGVGPLSFGLGTLSLALYKQLQNAEIGHVALHGTYDRFPQLEWLHRAHFRWQAPLHEDAWVAMHNSAHHPFSHSAGKDPDLHFGPVRLSKQVPWAPYHRANLALMLMVHLFHMSLTTLYYGGLLDLVWVTGGHAGRELRLSERDARRARMGALRKYGRHALREYGLFPLLAGVNAPRVMLGNFLSSRLRDVFTSMSILVNHVGPDLADHEYSAGADDADAWYARQVETSQDLTLPYWLSVLMGALDCHIEHHLFPELPPNRLREIRAEVERVCAAYGVRHTKQPWPTAVWRAWRAVHELGRREAASAVAAST